MAVILVPHNLARMVALVPYVETVLNVYVLHCIVGASVKTMKVNLITHEPRHVISNNVVF